MTCSECGESTDGAVFDCHHHNTAEHTDDVGNLVVDCTDCPAWWIVKADD